MANAGIPNFICTDSTAWCVSSLTPVKYRENLAATLVRPELSAGQAVLAETWVTTLLILAVFGATNAARRPVFMPSLVIGLAVVVGGSTGVSWIHHTDVV